MYVCLYISMYMLHCKSGNVQIKCSRRKATNVNYSKNLQQTSDDKRKNKKAEATLTQ